jgi:carbonic anhydrase
VIHKILFNLRLNSKKFLKIGGNSGKFIYKTSAKSSMETSNTIRAFLDQILGDNKEHMDTIKRDEYKIFETVQTPRATVVMCSDSRVQTKAITSMDVNDLFVVRNIGNQVINSSGSIEFGIRFLKTPVLLIIGHSGCGAVEAVVNGTDVQNGCIERELETIDVEGECLNDAILQNVHGQVRTSIRKFKKLIQDQKLVVIGAIYDFQDTYKRGLGRLIIINVNGEKSADLIKIHPYLKDISHLITL